MAKPLEMIAEVRQTSHVAFFFLDLLIVMGAGERAVSNRPERGSAAASVQRMEQRKVGDALFRRREGQGEKMCSLFYAYDVLHPQLFAEAKIPAQLGRHAKPSGSQVIVTAFSNQKKELIVFFPSIVRFALTLFQTTKSLGWRATISFAATVTPTI